MVNKLPKTKNANTLTVPFSIRIFKKCIEFGVDFALVKHLHLYDLQCLLIQFDTQKVLEYLKSEETKKLRARGISSVRDVSGSEALKLLRG